MNIWFRYILLFMLAITATGCATAGNEANGNGSRETVIAPASIRDSSRREDEPLASVSFDTRPWVFQNNEGVVITTPHYRLHTTIRYDRVVNRLPLFYERALQRYGSALADLPLPEEPMDSFLFQSRRQWKLKTNEVLPQRAGMFMNLGRGGFTTRGISVLYYIDYRGYSRDTLAIAAHEGWHQFTQSTFGNPLPVWLEEGIACYMEGYYNTEEGEPVFAPEANRERRNELRNALREKRLISLPELLENSPQDFLRDGRDELLTYYAQVWALVRFLEAGEEGVYAEPLARALTDAARGHLAARLVSAPDGNTSTPAARPRRSRRDRKTGPALILEYMNPDLDAFGREYDRFVELLTRPSVRPRMRPKRSSR